MYWTEVTEHRGGSFALQRGMYVSGLNNNDKDIFVSGSNGLLVVQDLDQETPSVDAQRGEPIAFLQAGELGDEFPDILGSVLGQYPP